MTMDEKYMDTQMNIQIALHPKAMKLQWQVF